MPVTVTQPASQFSIVSDTTAPTGISIAIRGGSTYTNSNAVTISLTATGASEVILSENSDFSGASYEPYAANKPFGLTTGDGTKTVYAKFRDTAGNETSVISDTIILDTTPPTATITSTETSPTNAALIPFTVTFSEHVTSISCLAYNGTVDHSSISGNIYTYYIDPSADGEVTFVVYLKYIYDDAGNVDYNAEDVQLSIVSDTIPPTDMSISINGGNAYTDNTSVTLTLGATGASEMMISENSDFSGASYETYSSSKAFTLSSGDGEKTVYVKYKDAAGRRIDSGQRHDSAGHGSADRHKHQHKWRRCLYEQYIGDIDAQRNGR